MYISPFSVEKTNKQTLKTHPFLTLFFVKIVASDFLFQDKFITRFFFKKDIYIDLF